MRLFLVVTAFKSSPVEQIDINNVFLHGYLKETVYMRPPSGYKCQFIWSANSKVLIWFEKPSKEWNYELTNHLVLCGFLQSPHDHNLFTKKIETSFMALLVYVNDLLMMGQSIIEIEEIKASLHKAFTIKNLDPIKYFLGLEIAPSL